MQGVIDGAFRAKLAGVEGQERSVRPGLLAEWAKGDILLPQQPGIEWRGGLAPWASFDSGEGDVGVASAGFGGEAKGEAELVEVCAKLLQAGDPLNDLREDSPGGGGAGKCADASGVHGGEGDSGCKLLEVFGELVQLRVGGIAEKLKGQVQVGFRGGAQGAGRRELRVHQMQLYAQQGLAGGRGDGEGDEASGHLESVCSL